MKVILINQCAGNKGDRTVLLFVLRELQRNGVSRVWVSADGPGLDDVSDYRLSMDVEFIPPSNEVVRRRGTGIIRRAFSARNKLLMLRNFAAIRRMLSRGEKSLKPLSCNRAFRDALKQCDLVISTGGHHVTSLLVPDAQSSQMHDICVALSHGKRLLLWSQSIGPFTFRDALNERMVRWVLSEAAGIYVRDSKSHQELESLGISGNVVQTYESVIGLNDLFDDYVPPSQREKLIGVSIYDILERSPEEHERYARSMAGLVDWAVEQGYRPVFLPMQMKGQADDRMLIREILSLALYGSDDMLLDDDLEPSAHIREVAKCRLFVGHKTHSVILALAAGTPLVAIAYHPKTQDFMDQYGLSEYCISDDNLDVDILLRLASKALDNADAVGQKEFDVSRKFAARVREDFASMLASVSESGR